MRPLQQDNQTRRPTMRLRDPISSYKCFESIATPSPIATTSDGNSNVNSESRHSHHLHRATSLDSLANSSEQDTSEDADDVSDVDSISDFGGQDNKTVVSVQVHRKSDLEELNDVEKNVEQTNKAPVIKEYLEKSHRKCDYKNCGYKKKDKEDGHSPQPQAAQKILNHINMFDKNKAKESVKSSSVNDIETDESSVVESNNINNISSNTIPTVSGTKTRRTSIASSGSVGRMETILEEPIESKISVKEILARFETLNSLEVCFLLVIIFKLHL